MRKRLMGAKRQIARLIRQAGFVVERWPPSTVCSGHLAKLLRENHVDLVLDIGANEGQFALELQQARYSGRIVSFEPTPTTFQILAKRASQSTVWDVEELAISDVDGHAVLHTYSGHDWNSLRRLDHDQLAKSGRSMAETGSISCEVRRLDTMWPDIVRPHEQVFLKSDTQGHELAVLDGLGEHRRDIVGVLLEASIQTFYEGEPDLTTMLHRLDDVGFVPSGFFPVARTRSSLALNTVDVCFVRRPDVGR